MEKTEYDIQAQNFLNKTGSELTFKFIKWDLYFDDDKDKRDIYEITLKRGDRKFIFNFGNSVIHSGLFICYSPNGLIKVNDVKEANKLRAKYGDVKKNKEFKQPSAYDVLTCLQKYEIDSLKDFCGDFGYNEDSIKALKIYEAVNNEYNNLKMLYSDAEILQLQEIQ